MRDFEELLESLRTIEHDLDAQQQHQQAAQPACWDPRAAMAAERQPAQRSHESHLLRLGFRKSQVERPTPDESEWFIRQRDRLDGPVKERELIEWIRSGRIGPRDLVWHASLQGWSLVQDSYLATHVPAMPRSRDNQLPTSTVSSDERGVLRDDTIVHPEVVPDVVDDSQYSPQPLLACRNCGHPLQLGKKFCTHCGRRVSY